MTDRMFIYLRVEGDDNEELDQGMMSLQQAGHPCLILRLADKYAVGGEFFRWEFATAIAGVILNINPFDEPNVTESKEHTGQLLEYYRQHGELPPVEAAFTEHEVSLYADDKMLHLLSELSLQHHYSGSDLTSMMAAQFNSTRAGDYFAILAYLPPTDDIDTSLEHIRRRLRHATRRAVTVGYGPRYLHSTGQLYKGGADRGIFILITGDDPVDVPIPGEGYTFSTLKAAQAAGDLQALMNAGRRVLRLHIRGGVLAGMGKLLAAIDTVDERRH
jgi:hypothetical protein